MKMPINPFLFRLLLISAWYFSVSSFLGFGFLFGYIVFIPILIVYLVLIIQSFKQAEEKVITIKIGTDIFFISISVIELLWFIYWIIMAGPTGEGALGIFLILMFSPMPIMSIIWLINDINRKNHITK